MVLLWTIVVRVWYSVVAAAGLLVNRLAPFGSARRGSGPCWPVLR